MAEADTPDLALLAKMRDDMLASLERDLRAGGGEMEGLTLERLRAAMHQPRALETMAELLKGGPGRAQPGGPAPDFELPHLPGHGGAEGETVRLSDYFGRRPVALVFGSYT